MQRCKSIRKYNNLMNFYQKCLIVEKIQKAPSSCVFFSCFCNNNATIPRLVLFAGSADHSNHLAEGQ